ncbi:hypothetical protein [Algoriphagus aquimarinus]|uniref:Outer membrane protein beta-barrel domain-containing protein n=1 Tax=Algoriphagus aquimarinus TaxID=237018 RepID=A0A5C7ARM6_9BACT|nr:hypothetical protein [Algoriphagus aquimarinus]TXE10309.1 hypothetical protein ESV85_13320 [Algoriphagus aquimarinus]
MKEDKLDEEIAASLKKKLVEASVPYELGAWEGFQKKRAQRKRRTIAYWASGIAASLLLIAVGLNTVDTPENSTPSSTEIQLAESAEKSPENRVEEITTRGSEAVAENSDELVPNTNASGSKTAKEAPKVQKSDTTPADTKALASVPQPVKKAIEKPVKTEKVVPTAPIIPNEKTVAQVPEKQISQQQTLITKVGEVENPVDLEIPKETLALAKAEESAKLTEKEKFVAENEFPIIAKDKASVGLGMGLSPGFGAIQSDNQVATAQTIGLGMLVDIDLPGKLTLGSGLGLNYLNQNNEQESTVMSLGNTYPQVEKLEVRQMQVEVPVFVKYPVTRNNSVSIQAGFSNYYALNQTASQENTTERQSAFYANDALGNSSVSLRQESVVENNSLESKSGKFYPFATLNFGVNLRVLETKGANYVVMPFYNYQLKQVSGYGDTYGLFGASFKMNFGGGEK